MGLEKILIDRVTRRLQCAVDINRRFVGKSTIIFNYNIDKNYLFVCDKPRFGKLLKIFTWVGEALASQSALTLASQRATKVASTQEKKNFRKQKSFLEKLNSLKIRPRAILQNKLSDHYPNYRIQV